METILLTFLVSAILALILGFLLGFFKKAFYVEVDPKITQIRECLPGANCGGCGFPGCDGFSAACASGKAPVDGCSAGGVETAKKVAKVLGQQASGVKNISVLACRGSSECAANKGFYTGVKTCSAAKLSINGTKFCNWGCIGYGDCVASCKFDAIHIGPDSLPKIDTQKCTGCGLCVTACPQHLLSKMDIETKGVLVRCSNKTQNKPSVLKQCKVGCIKCGKCEKNCKQDAIHLIDNIPVVDYSKCTSCGDCISGCPTKVLTLFQDEIKVNL